MSDEPKPQSPVTAQPPALGATAITKRFPGTEGDSLLNLETRDSGTVVYRPMSIFAVAAFVIAITYSAVIVIGAAVSVVQRMPWLIGGWSVIFPLLALVLAGVAWFEIQSSEGTRTGKRMAAWAAMLSIMVSLGYWAYYGATYYVVRNQAQAYCQEFFDKIKQGKLESAFIMAVAPTKRPQDNSSLRDVIEQRFNPMPLRADRSSGGLFNAFKQHMLTHVIVQGGKDVQIEPLGVASWEYKGPTGGYAILMRYRVNGPELGWEGIITLNSMEPVGKVKGGRQWAIAMKETTNNPSSLVLSEEGSRLLGLQRGSSRYFDEWQGRLRSMDKSDHVLAYLSTQEPATREGVLRDYRQSLPATAAAMVGCATSDGLSGLTASCAATFASETHLPNYDAFTRGAIVSLTPDFWAPHEELKTISLPAARMVFHGTADIPMGVMKIEPSKLAYWVREGDKIRFRHHVQMQVRMMLQGLEGDIILECPASWLQTGPTADGWRIAGIELSSMRTLPQMPSEEGGGAANRLELPKMEK